MVKEDRRYLRTRQAISDAMWKLMQEKDFEQISIGEIAERANINRVTFYRHYEDKYAWLDNCIRTLLMELSDINQTVHVSKDQTALYDAFLKTFQHFDRNFQLYEILLNNKGTMFFQERFKNVQLDFLRSVAETKPQNCEQDFENHFVASAVAGSIEWWIRNDRPIPPEEMARKMMQIHQQMPWYRA